MKRSWQRLGSVSTPTRPQSISVPFHPLFQCRRDISTTLPALSSEAQDKPTRFRHTRNQTSVHHVVVEVNRRKRALRDQNTTAYSTHTKIYQQYLATVNGKGGDHIPLEIHQAVLRACTPPHDGLRAYTARLFQEGKLDWHQLGHPYESRFKEIMQNIARAGLEPSVKDYDFILSQFAAAGHYSGVQRYMHKMAKMGLEPTHKTFGYLLQAIAHRLSLRSSSERPAMVRKLVDIAIQTLREMAIRQIPPSPMNVDLAFRILSEANDPQGLAELLRLSYGMDLSYLDSPPIDTASVPSTSIANSSPEVMKFSTNALNSLLEAFGRWGQISKMIYVFETLTNPLPVPEKPDNAFDDDDDDFLPVQQQWKPHFAEPNTTSFNILIKYCTAHKFHRLAMHYATQLMHEEFMTAVRLRHELRKKPLEAVAASRLMVSAKTLRPIQALSDRMHNIPLLKRVIRICTISLKRKYRSWLYYDYAKSKLRPQLEPSTSNAPTTFSSPPSRSAKFEVDSHLWVLGCEIASLYDLRRNARIRLRNVRVREDARMNSRVLRGKAVYQRDQKAAVIMDPEEWKKKKESRQSKRRRKPKTGLETKPESDTKSEMEPDVKPEMKLKEYLEKDYDPTIADTSKP